MSSPNKEERQKCWDSRDKYWECLEKHEPQHNSTSGEDVPGPCKKLRKIFESNCPKQWIKHFDRKRTYDQFKKRMENGYDPLKQPKAS